MYFAELLVSPLCSFNFQFFCYFCRVIGEARNAVLHKGKKGFGFVLRGAKAASPLMEMVPSDKCPGKDTK